jgi:penicillin-binding protein 1A
VAEDEWRPDATNDSYALDAVRQQLDSLREAEGWESTDLVVETTLDLAAQRAAERAVGRRAAAIGAGAQGADGRARPAHGDIRALVGGRAYGARYTRGTLNRAFQAHRQPGSAFKPFVYAAALASGMTPATGVDDEPIDVSLGNGRVWSPGNYEGSYLGPTTLRSALAHSANGATVRVGQQLGEARVIEAARRNGIQSKLPAVPSVVLGAVEVTPLELVTAYAPFANGGFRVVPRMVTRVSAPDGAVLWTAPVRRAPVMDARDAFLLTSMLRSVVQEGTGQAIVRAGIRDPVAGKTGTTNNGSDVWFVGYTPTLVAGFWFGYDEPRSMGQGATGGRLAAPAWADFYLAGWKEHAGDWAAPAGLVRRRIDARNGDLANEYCPAIREEWFKQGNEPTRVCPDHTEPVYEPPPEPDYEPPPEAQDAPSPAAVEQEVKKAAKKAGGWFKRVFKF